MFARMFPIALEVLETAVALSTVIAVFVVR